MPRQNREGEVLTNAQMVNLLFFLQGGYEACFTPFLRKRFGSNAFFPARADGDGDHVGICGFQAMPGDDFVLLGLAIGGDRPSLLAQVSGAFPL